MQLVLLIETDFYTLKELENHLSGNRFRLVTTVNAKKGLEYAKSAPPDLIIISFHPQERETVDTLMYLKKDPITRQIPILALIGDFSQPFLDYLKKIGIADNLAKPIKKDIPIPKVNDLIKVSEKIRDTIVKETVHHISIPLNNEERTVIVFRSGIKNYVIPALRGTLNLEFIKSIIHKHIAVDIHTIPEVTVEELQILEKIVKLFGNKKLALITGTHLGNIMKNSDLSDYANLFLSMDDYELFLENPDLDE